MSQTINIIIADDHTLIRETWAFLLNSDPRFNVIAHTGNPIEAIEMVAMHNPDIVLMDINMEEIDGFEATKRILSFNPGSKIIAVSMLSQPAIAKKMINIGARGYVTKQSSKEEMIKAIMEVMGGKKYVCEEIRNIVAEQLMNDEKTPSINDLSQRELEIVGHIKKGLSSKEIAGELMITTKTVEVHRYNILKKLSLKNTAELINLASKAGL